MKKKCIVIENIRSRRLALKVANQNGYGMYHNDDRTTGEYKNTGYALVQWVPV